MKIKLSRARGTLFVLHNSIEEYIKSLPDEIIEKMKQEIEYNPKWRSVKDYEDLLSKMKEDKDMLKSYRESTATVTFPPTAIVRKEREWRDSGNQFDYGRYIEGRPCVSRIRKAVEYGSSRSNIIPIFVNLAEACKVPARKMVYKAIAVSEYVKACQAQRKNVEVYTSCVSRNCFRAETGGPRNFVEFIRVKSASAPLIPQKIIAGTSAYFFRCYILSKSERALRYNGLDLKDFGLSKAPTIAVGYGYPMQFSEIPNISKELDALGIHDFDKAVQVPSGLTSYVSLLDFRKKHGLTVRTPQ